MWGLLLLSASMRATSLPLLSMSSFLKTIFLSYGGRPHTVSTHIQDRLTLLHLMWGLFMSSASMSSPSFPLLCMTSFLSTIFLPHSGVPSQCFTSYSTSLNPPTPNVGINFVIRFYELSFSSSAFYEFFSVDNFLSHSMVPSQCFTSYSSSLNLLHPMWGLFLSSTSMSSPSFPLPSMSSFLSTIFSLSRGAPSHCFILYST